MKANFTKLTTWSKLLGREVKRIEVDSLRLLIE